MGKKGTLREAPGSELKRLVRVAMYCFGKVGRKYLNKKREEERSVLLVTQWTRADRHDPGGSKTFLQPRDNLGGSA